MRLALVFFSPFFYFLSTLQGTRSLHVHGTILQFPTDTSFMFSIASAVYVGLPPPFATSPRARLHLAVVVAHFFYVLVPSMRRCWRYFTLNSPVLGKSHLIYVYFCYTFFHLPYSNLNLATGYPALCILFFGHFDVFPVQASGVWGGPLWTRGGF